MNNLDEIKKILIENYLLKDENNNEYFNCKFPTKRDITDYKYSIKKQYEKDIPDYLKGIFVSNSNKTYSCIGVIADKLLLIDDISGEMLEWYSRKCIAVI